MNATDKDLEDYRKAKERRQDKTEKSVDDRFGLVGSRIGLVEGDVRELQITFITKEDFKEMKQELTSTIKDVGDRMSNENDRTIRRCVRPTNLFTFGRYRPHLSHITFLRPHLIADTLTN